MQHADHFSITMRKSLVGHASSEIGVYGVVIRCFQLSLVEKEVTKFLELHAALNLRSQFKDEGRNVCT